MNKLGNLLNMIYDSITFSSRFSMYLKTFLSHISLQPIKETKKIFKAKQQQDIFLNCILKKDSIENVDDFLKTTKKIL